MHQLKRGSCVEIEDYFLCTCPEEEILYENCINFNSSYILWAWANEFHMMVKIKFSKDYDHQFTTNERRSRRT